jgi:peroxiredoxin/uncharacterized membrane protein YphA (DoxX/SURF4 family)
LDELVALLRILLAATFIFSGVMKLPSLASFKSSLKDLGVPDSAAAPLAVAIPIVELVCGAALLYSPFVLLASLCLAALTLASSIVLASNLLRGNLPSCHCFGVLSSRPISWWELARNLTLLVMLLIVSWKGQDVAWPAKPQSVSTFDLLSLAFSFVLLALLLVEGWLLLGLVQRYGNITKRLDRELGIGADLGPAGLDIGAEAPEFELPAEDGRLVSLSSCLGNENGVVLFFFSTMCSHCTEAFPSINDWLASSNSHNPLPVAIIHSENNDQYEFSNDLAVPIKLSVEDWDTRMAYQVQGIPAAVRISKSGQIASQTASGSNAIQDLLNAIS